MGVDEAVTKKIVREAVHETLNGLGITMHKPQEMQADFIYIRKMRKGSELVSNSIKASVITVIIPTFLYLLWQAFKGALIR